jgi:hypothetical protein
VSKLATVALPIYSNPYNHNPPMKEHSQCLINRAASSSIEYKISMISVAEPHHFYAAPGENFDAAPDPALRLLPYCMARHNF